MSMMGRLRDRLSTIHDMIPLSDREKVLARMILDHSDETSMEEDIRSDPDWWGPKVTALVDYLSDQDKINA